MKKGFKERIQRDKYGFVVANNGLGKYYEDKSNTTTQKNTSNVSDLLSSNPYRKYEREAQIVNRKVILSND